MTKEEIQEMKEILGRFCDRVEIGKINPYQPDYENACRLVGRVPVDALSLVQVRTKHILREI